MRRGEVWVVELDPARGSEAAKTRRCVIVSRDASNTAVERFGKGVVTIVPLTSSISRVLPFQALVPAYPGNALVHDSKAQAEQVRSVDWSRLVAKLGTLHAEHLAAIDDALLVHLGLDG